MCNLTKRFSYCLYYSINIILILGAGTIIYFATLANESEEKPINNFAISLCTSIIAGCLGSLILSIRDIFDDFFITDIQDAIDDINDKITGNKGLKPLFKNVRRNEEHLNNLMINLLEVEKRMGKLPSIDDQFGTNDVDFLCSIQLIPFPCFIKKYDPNKNNFYDFQRNNAMTNFLEEYDLDYGKYSDYIKFQKRMYVSCDKHLYNKHIRNNKKTTSRWFLETPHGCRPNVICLTYKRIYKTGNNPLIFGLMIPLINKFYDNIDFFDDNDLLNIVNNKDVIEKIGNYYKVILRDYYPDNILEYMNKTGTCLWSTHYSCSNLICGSLGDFNKNKNEKIRISLIGFTTNGKGEYEEKEEMEI